MKVVGLLGRSGVGKNTLADLYFRKYGFYDVSLAEDLKIRAVGMGVASYEDVFRGAKPEHVRTWLQQEGTERGRDQYGQDFWVKSLFARLRRMRDAWGLDRFVITDVRFPNEAAFIRANGGFVWRIDAPQRNANNGMTDEQRQHPSEQAVDRIPHSQLDGIIYNDPHDQFVVGREIHNLLWSSGLIGMEPSVRGSW